MCCVLCACCVWLPAQNGLDYNKCKFFRKVS